MMILWPMIIMIMNLNHDALHQLARSYIDSHLDSRDQ
jgi:hypothetical protein